MLCAEGVFRPDGTFVSLPPIPEALLEAGFRRAVLDSLVGEGAISEKFRPRMLGWRYSGFSVHNQVRVAADDAEGRKKLAGCMLCAPLALEKMAYDAQTGTVIYRSKMHWALKRNFQVMPEAQLLELLLRHVPDRYEHLVRYVGWYSNRARGERAKARNDREAPNPCAASAEIASEFAQRAKAAWARLIRKVYEADPLQCPKCKGPMRFNRADRRSGCGAAYPRAPRALGTRARRAGPTRASSRLTGQRRHPPHLPRSPRHRVAQREGRMRPHLPLAPCRGVAPSRIALV